MSPEQFYGSARCLSPQVLQLLILTSSEELEPSRSSAVSYHVKALQ